MNTQEVKTDDIISFKNNKNCYEKIKFCIISNCKSQYYKKNLLFLLLNTKSKLLKLYFRFTI